MSAILSSVPSALTTKNSVITGSSPAQVLEKVSVEITPHVGGAISGSVVKSTLKDTTAFALNTPWVNSRRFPPSAKASSTFAPMVRVARGSPPTINWLTVNKAFSSVQLSEETIVLPAALVTIHRVVSTPTFSSLSTYPPSPPWPPLKTTSSKTSALTPRKSPESLSRYAVRRISQVRPPSHGTSKLKCGATARPVSS